MRTSLDLALAYVAAHPTHKIFPIARGVKTPPTIKNNLSPDVASNDIEVITAWHDRWPGCNWGLALKASFVIVVDVDCKAGKGGQRTFDMLQLEHGWPPTLQASTPSGGRHYYFNATDVAKYVFALGTNGFGLDIDSPNYVLIPGCELSDPVTGIATHYKWVNSAPMADAPDWFAKYLIEHDKTVNANVDKATPVVDLDVDKNVNAMIVWLKYKAPPSIENRNGDQTTLKVAMHLRDHGISQSKAVELMAEHYNVEFVCEPLWEIEALEKKVENAYLYASLNAPGEMTEEGQASPEVAEKAAKQAAAEFAADPIPSNAPSADPKADALADKARIAKEQVIARRGHERKWSRPEVIEEWVWVADIKRFVWRNYPDVMWDKETFDDYFGYLKPQNVPKFSRALFGTAKDTIRKLITLAYKPGEPEFCGSDENRALNLYKPSDIIPKQGDTAIWNDHMAYLFPDEEDRAHVLNWCAWLLQNLSEKPKHALLIAGHIPGAGKSFIAEVLSKILGKHNVQPVGEDELEGQFNEWALRAKLITIEELRTVDRGRVKMKLHPLITQDHIKVNDKNVKRISVTNCFGFFIMTNDDAAISLDNSDRRYLVVRTHAQRCTDEYGAMLYLKALRDKDFLAAVAYELQHRALANYSGAASAPDTRAKNEMISAGMSDVEHWMIEHANEYPLNCRITTLDDVLEAMPKDVLGHVARKRNVVGGVLTHHFKGVKLGQQKVPGSKPKSLWALNGTGATKIEGAPFGAIYLEDIKKSDQVVERSAKKDFEE